MSEAPVIEPVRPPARRGGAARRVLFGLGVTLCVLAVLVGLLYLNRRAATRQVLIGWLERQGVPADLDIERVEIDGIVARIRIGDPRNPDAVVERVEVDYAIGAPWSKAGLGSPPPASACSGPCSAPRSATAGSRSAVSIRWWIGSPAARPGPTRAGRWCWSNRAGSGSTPNTGR